MSKTILILFAFLFINCNSSKQLNDKVRKSPKFEIVPPGTTWLKDNLFIDYTEVSNFHYLEYVHWILRVQPKDYLSVLPDTLCWINDGTGQGDLKYYYFKHPVYRDFPVIGISYDQAVKYCNWRSDVVNLMLYLKANHIKDFNSDSTYNYPKIVKYRLPSKEEWIYAAQSGLNKTEYPLGYVDILDNKNKPVSNTKEYYNLKKLPIVLSANASGDTSYMPLQTESVIFGKPNIYGIYNMLGNVSELVSDSLIMGLNFQTYLNGQPQFNDKYTISKFQKYSNPKSWIGFRCICEVELKK